MSRIDFLHLFEAVAVNEDGNLTQSSPVEPEPNIQFTLTAAPRDTTSLAALPAGPAVANRYQLLEEIARGGMGVVHRAYDSVLKREVALKLIHAKHAQNPDITARFYEESRITGQLQHPGIPPVYDLGTLPDGRPFLAMKLIKGKTLFDLLKENPPLPAKLEIFEGICRAMAYAHSKGVIHRDLKPQNVMVGAFGETQVMDWGLAKVLVSPPRQQGSELAQADDSIIYDPREDSSVVSETKAGSAMGTYAYMPPEQANGDIDKIGPASDVFGLGAILCELLTGQPPYVAPNSAAMASLAGNAELEKAFERVDFNVSDSELKAICRKCLSRDAADRYATAGELSNAFDAYRQAAEAKAKQAEMGALE